MLITFFLMVLYFFVGYLMGKWRGRKEGYEQCKIETLKSLEEFFDRIDQRIDERRNTKQEEDCEGEDKCEYLSSLENDYVVFFRWAFGETQRSLEKSKAIGSWLNRHPELPVPRVFKVDKEITPGLFVTLLLMDAYPLFLEENSNDHS